MSDPAGQVGDRWLDRALRDAMVDTAPLGTLIVAGTLSGFLLALILPTLLFASSCFLSGPAPPGAASPFTALRPVSCAAAVPNFGGLIRSLWPYALAFLGVLHALFSRFPPGGRRWVAIEPWPGAGGRPIPHDVPAAWAVGLAVAGWAAWRWPGAHLWPNGLPLLVGLAPLTGWLWTTARHRFLLWGMPPDWEPLTAALVRHWLVRRFGLAGGPYAVTFEAATRTLAVRSALDEVEARRAADFFLQRVPGVRQVTFRYEQGEFVADSEHGGTEAGRWTGAGGSELARQASQSAGRTVAALRMARAQGLAGPGKPAHAGGVVGAFPSHCDERAPGAGWAWASLVGIAVMLTAIFWYLYAQGAYRPLTAEDLRTFFYGR